MNDTTQFLDQAIETLSLSDPLVKLLQEVKLGRMRPSDTGLRAITESWLETYRQVIDAAHQLDRTALLRIDPSPRLDILISAGVLDREHPAMRTVRAAFAQRLGKSQ
ncbi:MAG: hypothetical protein ACREJU_12005 [Nitrospiraceae bacterium]